MAVGAGLRRKRALTPQLVGFPCSLSYLPHRLGKFLIRTLAVLEGRPPHPRPDPKPDLSDILPVHQDPEGIPLRPALLRIQVRLPILGEEAVEVDHVPLPTNPIQAQGGLPRQGKPEAHTLPVGAVGLKPKAHLRMGQKPFQFRGKKVPTQGPIPHLKAKAFHIGTKRAFPETAEDLQVGRGLLPRG